MRDYVTFLVKKKAGGMDSRSQIPDEQPQIIMDYIFLRVLYQSRDAYGNEPVFKFLHLGT